MLGSNFEIKTQVFGLNVLAMVMMVNIVDPSMLVAESMLSRIKTHFPKLHN